MPYAIFDIDVTRPPPSLATSADEDGLAVICRHGVRPVGFALMPLAPDSRLTPATVEALIRGTVPPDLVVPCAEDAALPPEAGLDGGVSVAICTKDRPDLVQRCLTALLATCAQRAVEILVVDNAPSDNHTRDLVATLPGVRYVLEPRAGLDFARNRALAETRGAVLAFVDDDAVVDAGWLDGLRLGWAQNPDAGAVTGLILPLELETSAQILFERRGGFRKGFRKQRFEPGSGDGAYPANAFVFGVGCNMSFRREALLAIGGFDEALDTGTPLPGGGDLDIFYRVSRAGYAIAYEPRYCLFHQHRREWHKLRRQYWSWGLAFLAFLCKHDGDAAARPQVRRAGRDWLAFQLGELRRSLTPGRRLPMSMVLAEIGGGIAGLCGEYQRSQARVAAIRAAIPHPGPRPERSAQRHGACQAHDMLDPPLASQ